MLKGRENCLTPKELQKQRGGMKTVNAVPTHHGDS